jgi:hypothetical protein
VAKKKETKPVFQKSTSAQRRPAPERPVYTAAGAGESTSGKKTAANRPVFEPTQTTGRRTPPTRVEFHTQSASRGGTSAGQKRAQNSRTVQNNKPPVHREAAASRAENSTAKSRHTELPHSQSRRAEPPHQRTWQARPEQETTLKPRAPMYDQQAENRQGHRARAGASPGAVHTDATGVPRGPQPPPGTAPPTPQNAKRQTKKQKPKKQGKKRPRAPLTPEQARRRRAREKLAAAIVLALLCAGGILFSAAVIFKIKEIQVLRPDGDTVYTDAEILAAFGQPLGENLFGFDADSSAANIMAALPYLESVTVSRSLPDTIKITVTPAQEYAAVACDAGWAVVSRSMKVLRLDSEAPAELIAVQGVQALSPTPGQPLQAANEDADKLEVLCTLLEKAEAQGLTPITQVNVESVWELSLLYDGRIRIELGTSNDLDYKLEWAWRLVTPQTADSLDETERGTLDVSSRNSDGRGQAVWRAGNI